MDKSLKLFLTAISEHPHYQDFIDLVAANRPRVPTYNCSDDNTERWKFASGRQQGYDLFASFLNLKFEE